MQVKGFELVNEEKIDRALNGSITGNNTRIGGIIKEDGTYDEDALIAEYDKLAGLIMKGSDVVKTGCFYDFKNKRYSKEPKIIFQFRVNGKVVEVEDGVELPGIVKASKILKETEVEEVTEKKKRKK